MYFIQVQAQSRKSASLVPVPAGLANSARQFAGEHLLSCNVHLVLGLTYAKDMDHLQNLVLVALRPPYTKRERESGWVGLRER
jgi:hypothetical protein